MSETLGIVISTPGRRSLYRTLQSIEYQKENVEDVLVVGDGYHKPTAEMVELMGPPFRYIATQRTRDWGHTQVNYGLMHVKGTYVTVQDDDDIYAPRAIEEIIKIANAFGSPHPIIGRVKTPALGLLWNKVGEDATLDGHCIVIPNNKKKMGYMTSEYSGDQTYIRTSLQPYDNITWLDRVLTITRPTWELFSRRVNTKLNWGYSYNFYPDDNGIPGEVPVAKIHLSAFDDSYHCSIYAENLKPHQYQELVEFAIWASQGEDTTFAFKPLRDEHRPIIEALTDRGFKPYITKTEHTEYYHEWPPNWWAP